MSQLWLSLRVVLGSAGGQAEESARFERQSWVRLGVFVLLAVAALALCVLLSRAQPAPPRQPFDVRPRARLEAQHPQFILLGNSMVDTRFDEPTLRRALRNEHIAVMGMAATKSTVWYLALEHLIIPAGGHPRVILFYRNPELTDVRARSLGEDHVKLERVSPTDDPVVEAKLSPEWWHPIGWLAWQQYRAAPFARLRAKTEPISEAIALRFSELTWPDANPNERRRKTNELFQLENTRMQEAASDPAFEERSPPFSEVVNASLLPDYCHLAREHKIPLTFVRIRTREAAMGVPEAPSEHAYQAALEAYLKGACGAESYDLRDAAWESLDMYANGDHISGPAKRRYTALFAEHMRQIFH